MPVSQGSDSGPRPVPGLTDPVPSFTDSRQRQSCIERPRSDERTLTAAEWIPLMVHRLESVLQGSVNAMCTMGTQAPVVPSFVSTAEKAAISPLMADLLGVMGSLRDVSHFSVSAIQRLSQLQQAQMLSRDADGRSSLEGGTPTFVSTSLEPICEGTTQILSSMTEALHRLAHMHSDGSDSQALHPVSASKQQTPSIVFRASSGMIPEASHYQHSDFDGICWDDAFYEREDQLKMQRSQQMAKEEAAHELELRRLERRKSLLENDYLPVNALILTVDPFFIEVSDAQVRIGAMMCKHSSTKEIVPPSIGQFCCGLESKEESESGVFKPNPALMPLDEGYRREAGELSKIIFDRFDPLADDFDAFTTKERQSLVTKFNAVAAAYQQTHASREPLVWLDLSRAAYCGDMKGNFLSLHMIFMRTVPCGSYNCPSAGFVILGGYSGEHKHCVELLLCVISLAVAHPSLVHLLRGCMDEDHSTGDVKNSLSLRSRCRHFCEGEKTGDALWRCICSTLYTAPVAALLQQHNVFLSNSKPGVMNPVDRSFFGSTEGVMMQRYIALGPAGAERFLSEFNIGIFVCAGKPSQSNWIYDSQLMEQRVLYISSAASTYQDCNAPPEVPQACGLMISRILVFRWHCNQLDPEDLKDIHI